MIQLDIGLTHTRTKAMNKQSDTPRTDAITLLAGDPARDVMKLERDLESARKDAEILRRDISGYARDRAALIAALAHATSPVFNYDLQVWTRAGIVQMCGHPETMRQHGPCCNAARLAGRQVAQS
jgi:hypothetical protein